MTHEDGPPCKRILLDDVTRHDGELDRQVSTSLKSLHSQLEACYSIQCCCKLSKDDIETYIRLGQTRLSESSENLDFDKKDDILLYVNFLTWLGQVYHGQICSGHVCPALKSAVNVALDVNLHLLEKLISTLKFGDQDLKYSISEALKGLIPLNQCGQEVEIPNSSQSLQQIIEEIVRDQSVGDTDGHTELDSLTFGEEAGLGDFNVIEPILPKDTPETSVRTEHVSWLLSVLAGIVTHGSDHNTDDSDNHSPDVCQKENLGEDDLCQEMQIKCAIIKVIDPSWPLFTGYLKSVLLKFLPSSLTSSSSCLEIPLCTGFTVWRSLISVRANLPFVSCRVFSADLPQVLPLLSASTPASVWRAVLDTVSECLCYGTTLGLQSIPPDEPCQLAHVIIRLVRFNSFLSCVPYKSSLAFGGQASVGHPQCETSYDKGLVQKIVLIILKCVALTTREARVESSSGESDSSLSSRESVSSCGSDMIIIERTMSGMYKLLDSWIKQVIPILPQQSLQESLLQVLGEQDDVLIEGMLCLLDTHMALYVNGKREPEPGLLDTNPTRGFLTLLGIVSRDSSVLLDFLVSNETCFLLYFLRYLKFIIKDWESFVTTCGNDLDQTMQTLLDLKDSIGRLINKSLFPYNIGPVYRLLEKAEQFHLNKKDI